MMVMGTFGARRGVVVLVDKRKSEVEAITHRGIEKNLLELFVQTLKFRGFPESLGAGEALTGAEAEEVRCSERRAISDLLSSLQIQEWVPFSVNTHFRGGIGLGEKLSGDPYSTDDQELLGTLANQLTVALDNALAYREIEELNKGLEEKVQQRTEELRVQHEKLREAHSQLELRNRFIENAFGRYVSDEVVAGLLENPENLTLGGEKRKITILMSDLRGFTSLTERLAPEQVLTIVNRYLGTMVDVILRYQGTINEFIGDAILVLFGAPLVREDDARRAVACAVAMQQAMAEVNAQNRREGLPEVEMGIGINTGEVVIGNIGSHRRMKYGVVGSPANLASRVESYTVGGQILISQTTRQEVGSILTIAQQMEVEAKGIGKPLVLYDVRGIAGGYNLFRPEREEELLTLREQIPLRYTVVEGKQLSRTVLDGYFVKLSTKQGEVRSENPVPPLSNIKMQLMDGEGKVVLSDLYGKVLGHLSGGQLGFSVRFTSIPSETSLLKLLRHHTGATTTSLHLDLLGYGEESKGSQAS
jgi:class 3 adenylate cyclase